MVPPWQDSTHPLPTTITNSDYVSPLRVPTPKKIVGSTVTISFQDSSTDDAEAPSSEIVQLMVEKDHHLFKIVQLI